MIEFLLQNDVNTTLVALLGVVSLSIGFWGKPNSREFNFSASLLMASYLVFKMGGWEGSALQMVMIVTVVIFLLFWIVRADWQEWGAPVVQVVHLYALGLGLVSASAIFIVLVIVSRLKQSIGSE